MSPPSRSARRDPDLVVRALDRQPLRYAEGEDPALDRPGHVRAASAVVATSRGHLIVQDDALFLGLVGSCATVRAVTLPSPDGVRLFGDDRGNKRSKADFEAACRWPSGSGEVVVAFGSGSLPARERLLVVPLHPDHTLGEPTLVGASSLYAVLREAIGDAELNVEGAWRTPEGHLRLLQRGNGRGAVDAVLEVEGAWLDALLAGAETRPHLRSATRWSLGELEGVRLTFTDAAPLDGSRWLFSAAAEASPDAVADGPVVGSVVGWADDEGGAWAPVVDASGALLPCKLEGITPAGRTALVGVVDADDVTRPSELLRLSLEGPWPGSSAKP